MDKSNLSTWNNVDISMFFVFTEGEMYYIPYVALSSIVWSGDAIEAPGKLGLATVTLEGALPQGLELFRVSPGTEIIVSHSLCGHPGELEGQEAVMSLHVQEVLERLIPDLVVTDLSRVARAMIEVVATCEVELSDSTART